MTNSKKFENSMKEAWENPPAPFNPDYNPETVKKYEKHRSEMSNYSNELDKIEPELSDEQFDYLYNTFGRDSYLNYIKDTTDEEYVKTFLERRNNVTLEKHKIKEKDIEFTNPVPDGQIHYQDIEIKGKTIGVLIERENGVLNEVTTIYQMIFEEKYMPFTKNINVSDTSEDEGYFYAQFEELDDLIEFRNFIQNQENPPKQKKKKKQKNTM